MNSSVGSSDIACLPGAAGIKRYPDRELPDVGQAKSSRTFRIAFFSTLFLAVLLLLGAATKGRGIKYRLFGQKKVTPVHKPVVLASGQADPAIHFEKVALPITSQTSFTAVQVGPDHKLYAGTDDGRIFRYTIASDGTLNSPQLITSLQDAEGSPRLLVGFCFDPASTPTNLVMWACHGFYAFHDAPDFSGRVSRLSGPSLETCQDVVVGLPRSARDHLNNQPSFGPDGALYFPQGSSSASGGPDAVWSFRVEHMLNASILRLDPTRVTPGQPIDVRTVDGGGEYDPTAPAAPLTIYATGVRNAYDLVWASDGRLYVPVNGSSAGGAAPAGPGIAAIPLLSQTENDWLLNITPGAYYGHPNSAQGHYILNGGNPGNRHDTSVVPEYPIGTAPDPKWQPPILDFGPHVSADGVIEYHGAAFDGRLDHKLIVCRFNAGSDLIAIGLNSEGKVASLQTEIVGFTHFMNPLDLAEDLQNGNIYVAEYGARHITLLRPTTGMPTEVAQAGFLSISETYGPNAEHGRQLFSTTCITCHGPSGAGIPHTGANLRQSKWVAEKSDDELVEFIRAGRQKNDPNSQLHLLMPAKGGNATLDDAALHDVVTFLRSIQTDAKKDVVPED